MRVAVLGAGISGLVAAYRLRQRLGRTADIVVVERAQRTGGSLRTVEFAGGPIDLGAEAFVARRPEVPALLAELGLSGQLVRPSGLRPLIWADDRPHPMPDRTVMGIPTAAESMRGLIDDTALEYVASEVERPMRWRPGDDVAVGQLVGNRFGEQVVRRMVDPLLGGVYAGLSGSIGIRAALPALASALDAGATSLTAAARAALPPPSPDPVFGGIKAGYGALLDALRAAADITVRTGLTAEPIRRAANSWSLGSAGDGFDAVVVAVAAPDAARFLADICSSAAEALTGIGTASSALVALSLPETLPLPQNSGILVATGEPLRAKAFTLSSRKWPHLAGRGALVRASFGRYGDDTALRWSDDELVAAASLDLARILDVDVEPDGAAVQRWPQGLPQYGPGHAALIEQVQAQVADLPGIAVAGNYLDGVGVPACIATGAAAAGRVHRALVRRVG